jgi:hypothetical protein
MVPVFSVYRVKTEADEDDRLPPATSLVHPLKAGSRTRKGKIIKTDDLTCELDLSLDDPRAHDSGVMAVTASMGISHRASQTFAFLWFAVD